MMKRMLFSLIAVGAFSFAPGAAVAGAAVPSIAAVYDAGRCLVQSDRRAAVALLRALPLDDSLADLSVLRGDARACAGGASGASAMLVRGAIAQELFRRDFRGFGREPRSDRMVSFSLPVETSPAGSRAVELYRWGDCVVRNDSAGTERLLRSEVGSGGEAAAIAGLQAYMSACMPAGSRLTVRVWEVRSVFAQSAYNSLYRYWTGQLQSARNVVQQ